MSERPDFERVLAEHGLGHWREVADGRYRRACICGAVLDSHSTEAMDGTLRDHITAVLNAEVARWLAEVVAEELNQESVDFREWWSPNRPGCGPEDGAALDTLKQCLAWLRDRAAVLAPTDTTADEKGAGR